MYLNVTEIESAITGLHGAYPTLSELITAPHPTHQGRTCRLLRIGARSAHSADGILLLGGVHAREWIPPDALVSLTADLLEAYATGTGLGYGAASFSAAEVRQLLETVNLFVFPCVNPDGRAFSQATDPNWRKNRRPAPAGGGPRCVGVDINRNFDFLWDHIRHFASDSGVSASTNPCDYQVYRGSAAQSEPETCNVIWVLDNYPRIRWHLDVHSAVPVVLHSWGSDTNQTSRPAENFRNPELDGVRGRPGDDIGEYLTERDQVVEVELATRLASGVRAVRDVEYPVEQAMTLYPTSGASDDYAFSRHFADPTRTKVYAWCVECGSSFQPPYGEAEQVIREMSAGLLRFALGVHEVTDGLSVTLRTPALTFTGGTPGTPSTLPVEIDCSGELDVHLDVLSGPAEPFGLPEGESVTVPAPGRGARTTGQLWVSYTPDSARAADRGELTIRCRETGQQFIIPLTADSTARQPSPLASS